ncbi:hypothetical protein Tco_0023595 [Tanacetum coccineum]
MEDRRLLSRKLWFILTLREYSIYFILSSDSDLSIGIRAIATNKEQIKNLKSALGQLQDGIAQMEIGFADKSQHLEDLVMKLSDAVLFGKGGDKY